MAEGDRGFLTEADRKVMSGGKDDVKDRAAEQRKIRFRNRARRAMMEFHELFQELPPDEREYVFMPGQRSSFDAEHIRYGLTGMAAFAYLGFRQLSGDEEIANSQFIEAAERAERKLQAEADIDDTLELLENHRQGEGLTQAEITHLLEAATSGVIDTEDLVGLPFLDEL